MENKLLGGEAGRGGVETDKAGGTLILYDGPMVYVHPDGGPATDLTVVRLTLPQPVPPGESATFTIGFLSFLPEATQRTGYVGDFILAAQWYPKPGVLQADGTFNTHEMHFLSEFYADYARFDVTLHVPEGFLTAAVGERVGEHHYVQDNVHEFAFMAAPFGTLTEADGIEVWAPEEYANNRCREGVQKARAHMNERLMPYPYSKVTCVVVPFQAASSLGGMEYPTFFTSVGLPFSEIETAVHEYAHGYFYGIVGSNEFEVPFLDETLTSYMESEINPVKLSLHYTVSEHAAVRKSLDPLGVDAWHLRSAESYFSIYGHGVSVLRTLQNLLPTGDFDGGLRAYVQRWQFAHPSLADFELSLAEETSKPEIVHSVFEQLIYQPGIVDDRIYVADDVVTVERREAQLPQWVRVTFEDGSSEDYAWPAGDRWARRLFDKKVKHAELDPERRIVVDKRYVDNTTAKQTDVFWPLARRVLRLLLTVLVLG